MARLAPFRVRLWNIDDTDRGRGSQVAIIDDAADIGVSSYANEGGEMFFTIPQNHPAIGQIEPWLRHYEVSRLDGSGTYQPLGVGLVDDFVADKDEVIVYGLDYLSLFELSISAATTTYTSETYTSIIQDELSLAIFQPPETSLSVTRFITLGTISSVSETTTVLTSYQSRLEFIRQLCEILSSDDSTRPIVDVSREDPFTVTWGANVGSDRTNLPLIYGSSVVDFSFNPGLGDFATFGFAIGQQREGANLLFSKQSYASPSTYGVIQRSTVFLDVIDQAALNRKTKRYARDLGTGDRNLSLRIGSGAVAPDQFGNGDSFPVRIERGIVDIDALYTCWGWEWTGKKNGSEDLFLDLLPKRT